MIAKLIPPCLVLFAAVAMTAIAADVQADGKAIFEGKCSICHGKDGKGQTKMGARVGIKDLTDAQFQATFTDEQLLKILKEGLKNGEMTRMKAYGQVMSDEEIKAVIAYVRLFVKK